MALALVAGATAATALFSVRVPLSVAATATGDLAVSAQWQQPTPSWGSLYPGSVTPDSVLNVTATGAGQTLRWNLEVSVSVAADFAPHVSTQLWAGACGAGTSITATGYAPAGGLALGQTVPVCMRLTLSPTAPATLSGKSLNATITVHANQRGS
ncbi:hypothetical protein [Microbacterium lemovicicum]|uniref:hypothetical protein n=1 Tax=Microbacterium lemovicicum TaxID=1072463 RepID=UPI000F8F66D7|nr:hypothetical protein [Microbacterium lemovicicum]